jgi:predicted anti-sigma-YlaC factor YlaD
MASVTLCPTRTSTRRKLRIDWSRLTGHTVEVWLMGQHVVTGVVEQATDDDSVLWIAGSGAFTRRLFDKSTGYEVRV